MSRLQRKDELYFFVPEISTVYGATDTHLGCACISESLHSLSNVHRNWNDSVLWFDVLSWTNACSSSLRDINIGFLGFRIHSHECLPLAKLKVERGLSIAPIKRLRKHTWINVCRDGPRAHVHSCVSCEVLHSCLEQKRSCIVVNSLRCCILTFFFLPLLHAAITSYIRTIG